jgi:hypothetical protein
MEPSRAHPNPPALKTTTYFSAYTIKAAAQRSAANPNYFFYRGQRDNHLRAHPLGSYPQGQRFPHRGQSGGRPKDLSPLLTAGCRYLWDEIQTAVASGSLKARLASRCQTGAILVPNPRQAAVSLSDTRWHSESEQSLVPVEDRSTRSNRLSLGDVR